MNLDIMLKVYLQELPYLLHQLLFSLPFLWLITEKERLFSGNFYEISYNKRVNEEKRTKGDTYVSV